MKVSTWLGNEIPWKFQNSEGFYFLWKGLSLFGVQKTEMNILIFIVILAVLIAALKFSNRYFRIDKESESPMYKWKKSGCDRKTIFPWEDVFNSKIISPQVNSHIPCPKCLKEFAKNKSEGKTVGEEMRNHLITVDFRSPNSTWRALCGRAGYLTICTKHKRQVDFVCIMMN